MIETLNEGKMPHGSQATYEAFEGLLASYCYTYEHFKHSLLKREQAQYQKLLTVLNTLAKEYGVQLPEEAVKNPRTDDEKWKPQKMMYKELIENIFAFYRVFHINHSKKGGEDELIKLHGVLNHSVMVF
jgi:hypothetical protein